MFPKVLGVKFSHLRSLLHLILPRFFPCQALSYAGGFGKVLVPHVVETELVQDDGSVVKRLDCSMALCRNDHTDTNDRAFVHRAAWCDYTHFHLYMVA